MLRHPQGRSRFRHAFAANHPDFHCLAVTLQHYSIAVL
jgi:hypothetical protein